jgi:hypothetical protein
MLTCYFDEAGGDDQKWTIVAGYVSSVLRWQTFESDWKILLNKYDVPYLHMKEVAHFKGPYLKWKRETGTRARFLGTAADIINSNAMFGISVSVNYKDFEHANREYDLISTLSSPYALAGRSCIAEANVARGEMIQSGILDMEYIFERGGPDAGGLINAVSKLTPVLPEPIFKPSRDWNGQRGVIHLQAADYLAYEIRKYVVDHPKYKSGERFTRASLGALAAIEIRRRFWSVDRIKALCSRMGLEKRNA